MKRTIESTLLVALFFLSFGSGNGRREMSLAETEISQSYIKGINKALVEPEGCPGITNCPRSCPMGFVRDIHTDCFMCQCRTNGKFEGDIEVSSSDFHLLTERYTNRRRAKRGAVSLKDSQWPKINNFVYVPYVFHSTISGRKKGKIFEAMREFKAKTCIRFTRRTRQEDYIELYGLGGCSSHVGKTGGKQRVAIGRNCENRLGIVIHEMMHSLGFWHEQSRGDRDNYVQVVWGNIMPSAKSSFKKQHKFWTSYGSPYDVKSVMHYDGDYFAKSKGATTLIDKSTGHRVQAQRDHLSKEDIRQINLKYGCTAYLPNQETPSPKKKSVPTCRDHLAKSTCALYERKNFCRFDNFKSKCKVTCKICIEAVPDRPVRKLTVIEECTDKSKHCDSFMSKGYCTTLKSSMKKFCQKSCSMCESDIFPPASCKDLSTRCTRWARTGYCTRRSHQEYMTNNCMKSCGGCNTNR